MTRSFWIVLIVISILMIGCAWPPTRIEKTYIQVNQQKTGPVDVFSSFDEIGTSYKKVAELEVSAQR